jgi:secreted trypsin-like serine protease
MMKSIVIFIVSCFVAFASSQEDISQHVVGGVDASILDHPYMAGIHVWFRNEWAPFCGSTIINRRSVLTVIF